MTSPSSSNPIKSLTLLKPIDPKMRITVLPFIPVYAIAAGCMIDPASVWGQETYEDWGVFIDFGNAVSLPLIAVLHVFVFLLTKWLPKLRAYTDYKTIPDSQPANASHVHVDVFEHRGQPSIVPLEFDSGLATRCFFFQQSKYYLDKVSNKFVRPVYPDSEKLSHYHSLVSRDASETVNSDVLKERKDLFGSNSVETSIPPFQEMLMDHMMAPFFVFQIFCVLLWCLDEYWMVAMLNGVMMVGLECTVVMQRQRNMKTMRDMGTVPVSDVFVRRVDPTKRSKDNSVFVPVRSSELLPNDVVFISLSSSLQPQKKKLVLPTPTSSSSSSSSSAAPKTFSAPADMILVRGSAVLNEATLTGESTPQLKQAASSSESDAQKEYSDTKHAANTIFSGTQVLTSSGHRVTINSKEHEGCLAVITRTGFDTKQGELMRTIAHSQSRVSQNSGEAFGFIGLLLVFACVASTYVLKRGLADPTKSRWKLFLTCTQIITSVVPPELPMQLTLAVNTSLVALMKLKVFCTEPFRIPFAGKINVCCFDKTGTLTTDEMLFAGIHINNNNNGEGEQQEKIVFNSESMPLEPDLVIGSCHSLVTLDDDSSSSSSSALTATTTTASTATSSTATSSAGGGGSKTAGDAMEKAAADALGWNVESGGDQSSKKLSSSSSKTEKRIIKIRQRFAFDPSLRRMSCIIHDNQTNKHYVVAKGSPESILEILSTSKIPSHYRKSAHSHTAKGLRVIALAIREVNESSGEKLNDLKKNRELAEKDLLFCGFALFDCPLKRDAPDTIRQLNEGSHTCLMITGDSCRTAIVVAKKVDMIPSTSETQVYIAVSPDSKSSPSNKIMWCPLDGETMEINREAGVDKFPLKQKHVVGAIDGDEISDAAFEHLLNNEQEAPQILLRIIVWARCPPTYKEHIVCALKKYCDATVLMAGDGTNDVGGLKQAHVGIAVLNSSSFQVDENTSSSSSSSSTTGSGVPGEPQPPPPLAANAGFMDKMKHTMAQAQYEAFQKQKQIREAAKEKQKEQKEKMQNALQKSREEKGLLTKKKEGESGGVAGGGGGDEAAVNAMNSLFNELGEAEDGNDAPMVKLGDASIAAPFTCKSRKLTAVCDIVRLGRCTLVTTLQMYKIIALNCLVSAYTMAVLFTDGVKFSQTQMVSSGIVLAICFLLLSFSKPLETLSRKRPVTRVFDPYMMVSIFGQFAIHLYSLAQSVDLVLASDPEGVASQKGDDEEVDFKPSLLNSIVFLMTTLMSVSTFAVNYRGRPFMTGLTDNKGMMALLGILGGLVFYCALEYDNDFNSEFEISKFPSEEFRNKFLNLLVIDVVGTFLVEFVSDTLLGPKEQK